MAMVGWLTVTGVVGDSSSELGVFIAPIGLLQEQQLLPPAPLGARVSCIRGLAVCGSALLWQRVCHSRDVGIDSPLEGQAAKVSPCPAAKVHVPGPHLHCAQLAVVGMQKCRLQVQAAGKGNREGKCSRGIPS